MNKDTLLNFLSERLDLDVESIQEDTPLFSSGALDSFSLLELIVFVEQTTGRPVPADRIRLEQVDSIDRILAFVETLVVK